MNIRPEQPQDYPAIHEVNRLAFGGEYEVRLVEKLRLRPDFMPNLSLVAEQQGQIIGHILFSVIHIHTPSGPVALLSLAPMAVRPEFQNQGIGSMLVGEGLSRCKETDYPAVIVLGHPKFYPRFGFRQAAELGIGCPFDAPPEAWMVYELQPHALQGVHGLVEYPAEFEE